MQNKVSFQHREFEVVYTISTTVTNEDLNILFASAWNNHTSSNFTSILKRSLAFICAYHETRLVGFVNIAWDGGAHAFLLDTTVDPEYQRRGIGQQLVKQAVEVAKGYGIEWLHVDYEPNLEGFYEQCGFRSTKAGLMKLTGDAT
jgi:GNAT superfamily N-acetyltransferase